MVLQNNQVRKMNQQISYLKKQSSQKATILKSYSIKTKKQLLIGLAFSFLILNKKSKKFNTNDMIPRKKSNLSSCFDIEYNSAKSLTNKYKLFGTKSKLPERIDRIKNSVL